MYEVFFFMQKTAYEMRISDWSSDVCSSDLAELAVGTPSLDSGGCATVDTRHQAQGDGGPAAKVAGNLNDALQLEGGINVDGLDAGGDGFGEFGDGLGDTIEDDSLGCEASQPGLPQFAT